MTAPSIDDLLSEFGTKPFTLADYQRERAALERRFLAERGIAAADIDDAVRHRLKCTDPLVEEWVDLQSLAPYVTAEEAFCMAAPGPLDELHQLRSEAAEARRALLATGMPPELTLPDGIRWLAAQRPIWPESARQAAIAEGRAQVEAIAADEVRAAVIGEIMADGETVCDLKLQAKAQRRAERIADRIAGKLAGKERP